MWKIKTVTTEKNPDIKVEGDKLQTKLTMVFAKEGQPDETFTTTVENENVLHATVASIENRLNERDAFQDKDFSVYVAPTVPEPEPPTPEQIKEFEIQQKEQELATVVEKAKKEKEIEELALDNPEVARVLNELKDKKEEVIKK